MISHTLNITPHLLASTLLLSVGSTATLAQSSSDNNRVNSDSYNKTDQQNRSINQDNNAIDIRKDKDSAVKPDTYRDSYKKQESG